MAIPTSTSIDKTNLFSQSHANIFNLINNRSNIPDPISLDGTRKFVYVREPRDLGRGFSGYPIIIIPPVNISQNKGTISNTKEFVNWDINITIYTSDKTSDSSGNPSGAELLNTISDNILKTLNSDNTIRLNGLPMMSISSSPSDWEEIDGEMIFTREFTLIFRGLKTIQ